MVDKHTHNGTDSDQLFGGDLLNAPQEALTAADETALATSTDFTGPTSYLTSANVATFNNMRTRIDEIETKLRTLGLLK